MPRTRSKYTSPAPSAGKRVRPSFGFGFISDWLSSSIWLFSCRATKSFMRNCKVLKGHCFLLSHFTTESRRPFSTLQSCIYDFVARQEKSHIRYAWLTELYCHVNFQISKARSSEIDGKKKRKSNNNRGRGSTIRMKDECLHNHWGLSHSIKVNKVYLTTPWMSCCLCGGHF